MPVKDKILLHYVPHGVNSDTFKPLPFNDKQLLEGKKRFYNGKTYDYAVFLNSRNTKRKQISNLLLAFRLFCDMLTKEQSSKCCLILHTEITGQHGHGTDLLAVKESLCKDYAVYFSQQKITPKDMNLMYNLADVTVGIASNEGFGLSVDESIMSGTPVIVNVTGGLQDQIGQVDDNGNPIEFTKDFSTNNIGRYKKHGCWAKPIWPVHHDVHGSNQTPYIFDDMASIPDIVESLMYWYLAGPELREKCGEEGRRWALNEGGLNSKNMCNQFIKAMDYTLTNFEPESSFSIHTTDECINNIQPDNHIGMTFSSPDVNKIKEQLKNLV